MSIKSKLKSGKISIGTWVQMPSVHAAFILAKTGFDWICFDLEHGAITHETLSIMVQAVQSTGCIPFARVAGTDPILIKQALDTGIQGIILPMINSELDAKRALSACFYPPLGTRGVGFSLANSYGKEFESYFHSIHHNLCVVLQIEHISAVKDLDAIFTLQGIDAVMIGPYDLSASMGKTGKFDDPSYQNLINQIYSQAKNHHISPGLHIVNPSPEEFTQRVSEGFQFIAYGIDAVFLNRIATDHVSLLRHGILEKKK